MVNPFDAAFRQARSAVGAAGVLEAAEQYGSIAEAVGDCTFVVGTTAVRDRHLHHPVRRLEYGARLIRRRLASRPVALLFGSEKFGLSNATSAIATGSCASPPGRDISMNLGQAVAVCLYELVRDGKSPRPPEKRKQPRLAMWSSSPRILGGVLSDQRLYALRPPAYVEEKSPPGAPATWSPRTPKSGWACCVKSCGSRSLRKIRKNKE